MYELKHWLNDINYEKKNLMDSGDEMWERKYPAYIVNKALSSFPETILFVNEMNKMHHLDKKLQFDFYINSIRPKKRFSKWMKASKIKNLEYVKEYYGYNNDKARQALRILNEKQIEEIKNILSRGGKNGTGGLGSKPHAGGKT